MTAVNPTDLVSVKDYLAGDAVIALPEIEASLTFAELYEQVEFEV